MVAIHTAAVNTGCFTSAASVYLLLNLFPNLAKTLKSKEYLHINMYYFYVNFIQPEKWICHDESGVEAPILQPFLIFNLIWH
ncbi:hypothetical protein C1N53_03265 [Pontibacter sp. SGAir0037]|nr:hypothetical protein C1N53_03265 [Pontibacter sp. SGAir0037]